MSLFTGLINQVKQCPLGTIALLLWTLLFLFSSADKTTTDKGTFIVLTLTLFALVWYSYETHKMVKIQYETYQASRRPLLSVNVQSSQDVKYTTFFQLMNHRDYFTEVWVYAELRFNNQPRPISDHYNGKKSWLIQPKDDISAPIELPKVVFAESFGYTATEINSFLGYVKDRNLTLKIKIKYKSMEGDSGEFRENPEVNYHYSFDSQAWILDVDVVKAA